ncbi:TPA: hypothetical protein U1Z41_000287, partial [Streptococcus suis]|nr:hypothetical protein [Streptococcus suis]
SNISAALSVAGELVDEILASKFVFDSGVVEIDSSLTFLASTSVEGTAPTVGEFVPVVVSTSEVPSFPTIPVDVATTFSAVNSRVSEVFMTYSELAVVEVFSLTSAAKTTSVVENSKPRASTPTAPWIPFLILPKPLNS